MSAFMVDKEHIDILIRVAMRGPEGGQHQWYRPYFQCQSINEEMADVIGAELVRANMQSIEARYPDTRQGGGVPGPHDHYWEQSYRYADPGYDMTIVEAFKAIDCYEYQACEFDGWDTSDAKNFCEALRHCLGSKLPGYDEAPWGWSAADIQEARQRRNPPIEVRRAAYRKAQQTVLTMSAPGKA